MFRAQPEERSTNQMAPMEPTTGRFTQALAPVAGVDPRIGSDNVASVAPEEDAAVPDLSGGFPRQASSLPDLDRPPAGAGLDDARSGSGPRLPPSQPVPTSGSFPIPQEAMGMPGFRGAGASAPDARVTAPQAQSRATAPMSAREDSAPTRMTDEMAAFVDAGYSGGFGAVPDTSSDDATENYELDLGAYGGNNELELDRSGTGSNELPGQPGGLGEDGISSDDAYAETTIGGIRGPNPARVSKTVDPLMEFGDVFREARGDEADGARRYLDNGFLDGDDENAESQRKSPEELQLMGGRPDLDAQSDPFGRVEAPRTRGLQSIKIPSSSTSNNESGLLELALRESGLHEPAVAEEPLPPSPEPAQPALATVLKPRPSGGNPDAEMMSRTSPLVGTLLVIVLTLVGVAGYMASKNDGILDLKDLDQMIGVAFRGEPYRPRTSALAAAMPTEGSGEVVGAPVAAIASLAPDDLELDELDDGRFELSEGSGFVVIEGAVTNISDARTYRRIEIEVALINQDGSVAHERRASAGNRLEQPELVSARTEALLDAVHDRVAEDVAELVIGPRQQTPFSAAFLLPTGPETAELTYRARVVSAERQLDSCWAPVRLEERHTAADDSGTATP